MRLAIVADIHGNVTALEAVIADMAGRQTDAVVNLGDCVSGPLWPRETLDLLRTKTWPTVRGNHDRAVSGPDPDLLGPSDRYAFEALSAIDRAWLGALPGTASVAPGVVAFHARPDDDEAYLLEDRWGDRLVGATTATIRARLEGTQADLVLTGHSHRQHSLKLPGGPWVVNPGSVGCPAYDDDSTDPPHISECGHPAACYAIAEFRAHGLMIELLSVPYPHDVAADRAMANGRAGWAHALRTGYSLRDGADF